MALRPIYSLHVGPGSIWFDPDTGTLKRQTSASLNPRSDEFEEIAAGGGTGDVTGPVSSSDGAVAVWGGVGGDTLQDGPVIGAIGEQLIEAADADTALTALGITEVADTRVVELQVGAPGENIATGDGQAQFVLPAFMDGWDVTDVRLDGDVAGTTGTMDWQLRRRRSGSSVDVLSTKVTVDSTETSSSTAATPAVIDASNDDAATGDVYFADIDAVQTTPATGIWTLSVTFTKP